MLYGLRVVVVRISVVVSGVVTPVVMSVVLVTKTVWSTVTPSVLVWVWLRTIVRVPSTALPAKNPIRAHTTTRARTAQKRATDSRHVVPAERAPHKLAFSGLEDGWVQLLPTAAPELRRRSRRR